MANETAPRRSEADLQDLKASWCADPTWDIEETEGFEAHRVELVTYRHQQEAKWENERQEKLRKRADELGCPGNIKLAQYVDALESRLESQFETIWRGLEEARKGSR